MKHLYCFTEEEPSQMMMSSFNGFAEELIDMWNKRVGSWGTLQHPIADNSKSCCMLDVGLWGRHLC